jgi:hypothetical protein
VGEQNTSVKNIVSFGCSWAYGDELIDPKLEGHGIPSHYTQNDEYRLSRCYTGLLAKQFNLVQENLAFPGSSLQSMQWNLMWWLDNHTEDYIKDSVLLVGLTDESRTSWFNPNHEVGYDDPEWNRHLHAQWLDHAGPNVDDNWHELRKYYTAMSSCADLYKLNYSTTVRLFDGVSSRYGIPVVQVNTIAKSHIDCNTLVDVNIRSELNNENKHFPVYNPGGHPNELGHVIIAELLTKYLTDI